MNFWEYKDDHMRGYYLPRRNPYPICQAETFFRSLFFLFAGLLKLVGSVIYFAGALGLVVLRSSWNCGRRFGTVYK
jgi:hypothetical protein